jgi:uncharacterized membrane protein YhaH (DUF805 family)
MEEWFLNVLKNKYADFEGRARRKEYWMFTLFHIIILASVLVLGLISAFLISKVLGFLFLGVYLLINFGLLVPYLAALVRRLHDVGQSGWFVLVSFIPIVGPVIVLVFLCLDSQSGENQYGPNPKESV